MPPGTALDPTLTPQAVQVAARKAGIHPNHWYPVGWARDWLPGQVRGVVVWNRAIAIYRGTSGLLGAMDDACPHKGVELSRGKVVGDRLVCRYHGWAFDAGGTCCQIPYWPGDRSLPRATARSLPIREHCGILWVFPGDPNQADQVPLLEMPEYGDPQWFMVPVTGHFFAHFSICNENSMDVFHGFLHADLQGWYDPMLERLWDTGRGVAATYRVSYGGKLARFLGLSDRSGTNTRPITVEYRYPHYCSHLDGVSALYLTRMPVSATESRSFALFFLRLNLPAWIHHPLQRPLSHVLERVVFRRFLNQDREMVESEQRAYSVDPHRRYVEINPATIAVQREIVRQYEQAKQVCPDYL